MDRGFPSYLSLSLWCSWPVTDPTGLSWREAISGWTSSGRIFVQNLIDGGRDGSLLIRPSRVRRLPAAARGRGRATSCVSPGCPQPDFGQWFVANYRLALKASQWWILLKNQREKFYCNNNFTMISQFERSEARIGHRFKLGMGNHVCEPRALLRTS